MSDRLKQIRALLQKEPRDVFLHYSLGKELAAAGQTDEALQAYSECMRLDRAYLPAYVEAAVCLRAAGRIDEARSALETALTVAQEQNQQHTTENIRRQLEGL